MSSEAQKPSITDTTDDPLLKALARLEKGEDAGGGAAMATATAVAEEPVPPRATSAPPLTPAQQKLKEQAEAMASVVRSPLDSGQQASPAMPMNAAALRMQQERLKQKANATATARAAPSQHAAVSPAGSELAAPPAPVSASAVADPGTVAKPPSETAGSPPESGEPTAQAPAPGEKDGEQEARSSQPAPESKTRLPAQRPAGVAPAKLDDSPSALPENPPAKAKPTAEAPPAAPSQPTPPTAVHPQRAGTPVAPQSAPQPVGSREIEQRVAAHAPMPESDPVPERVVLAPGDHESAPEVTHSDALPLVDDVSDAARKRGRNRRKPAGTMKVVFTVLAVQALLAVIGLAIVYFSPSIRGKFRNAMHRLLGTKSVIAAAEPAWVPEDLENTASLPVFDSSMGGDQLSLLRASVEDLQRQLSVTPKEAWKELRLLSQRNQLTAYADEAVTLGSRKSYADLKQIAETSTEPALRHGAEAELLSVKFFYASGTRMGAYKLPVTTLYPTMKSSAEEDLSVAQLKKLLLDQNKDWRVRSRVALLLGDSRSYDVAEALVQAVREDPSLDVVKEAIFSFEENTGYRSPGLFEIDHLLKWWEENSARLKSRSS